MPCRVWRCFFALRQTSVAKIAACRVSGDETVFGAVEPSVEFCLRLASDHVVKRGDRIARLDDKPNAALYCDCGNSHGLRFCQVFAADRQQPRDRPRRRRVAER